MMGKVRKKFPAEEKKLMDDGLSIRNAISFDFIAVNKAARVEDKARALEVGTVNYSKANLRGYGRAAETP